MIGLALCKHSGCERPFLFQMPRYESLKDGDEVIVDTKYGEERAVVEATATVYGGDKEYNMILKAAGATEPLRKVLKKVICKELKYDDEDLAVWDTLERDTEEADE